MSTREHQVLALIREDPMLRQQAIAEQLGISRSAVAGHIMNLTDKGLIKGRAYVLGDTKFVTIVGGANIDIHGKSLAALRQRDSNPGTVTTSAGGVARNIAENLARLGVDARLISAIGNDQHGEMLMRLSRDAGIDMQYVHEIATAPTSTYVSIVDDSGEMQLAISDMSIMDQLGAARLKTHKMLLRQSSLIVLDTNLPDDALAWLTRSAKHTPIFADTVSTAKALRIKPYLSSIHTLKASSLEAAALTDCETRTQSQLRHVAGLLHEQGVLRVFISRGAQGVFYSDDTTNGVASHRRRTSKIRNAGGAGDAFLAGLAYAWLEELPASDALNFALAAADVTLSHSSTSSPVLSVGTVMQTLETQVAQ